MALIKVENLNYRYHDGTDALKNVCLEIPAGTKTALLGPNGAGKTTLLLHLNGIFRPESGKVTVLGKNVNKETQKWVRSRVGFVFQDPDDQVFSPTVWDDVAFGPRNMGLSGKALDDKVMQALKAVGVDGLVDKAPQNMSYGQKKRVAIAGVLAMEPEVIILDEPVAYLDPAGKEDLFNILDRLNEAGTSVIVATHDVNLAAQWAQQIIIIKDGAILAQGGTDLLVNKDVVRAAHLTLPIVSQIFDGLPGWDKPLPKTIEEARTILCQGTVL